MADNHPPASIYKVPHYQENDMGRPHIALPQQLANELNASNQMAAAQMQMREQRKLLDEQRQIEQQRYVERFIQNTAKDIFAGYLVNQGGYMDMIDIITEEREKELAGIANHCEHAAVVLAKALGLLVEAEKEELTTNDAEVLGPDIAMKEQTDGKV